MVASALTMMATRKRSFQHAQVRALVIEADRARSSVRVRTDEIVGLA